MYLVCLKKTERMSENGNELTHVGQYLDPQLYSNLDIE